MNAAQQREMPNVARWMRWPLLAFADVAGRERASTLRFLAALLVDEANRIDMHEDARELAKLPSAGGEA